jgi:hypothetical protein
MKMVQAEISEVHQTHHGHMKPICACRELSGDSKSKKNGAKILCFGGVIQETCGVNLQNCD